ncbi:MAG: 4Fe-4S binding protein [Proteobacteria bacterium]|nr:4Fe-4S binding protein [Pseudomonadota bacterium]MBU2630293.1 4Fe-4S binding protein [Pseudomonadota bacterium]
MREKILLYIAEYQYLARRFVQILFLMLVINIGIKFYLFVSQIEAGILPNFERPPGVEAFLPISALVSLKHFLFTGTINEIHPSALVLFLIICLTALIAKKGFCSWVCPFGLLSEVLGKIHSHVFKKGLSIPFQLDLILRSLKYVIAGFFIYSIFYKMPMFSVEQFIQSPYNRFADLKMLKFFTRISGTALTVILALIVISIVIRYFWCRYLCPYGAILGIISFLSLGKIKRNASNCTDCGRCEKTCPSSIKIRQDRYINSSECTACMACIQICPEENAIGFSFFSGKLRVNQTGLALILVLMFTLGIFMAKISGNWQNKVSKIEYLGYTMQSNLQLRNKGQADLKKIEKMIEIMKRIKAQKTDMNHSFKGKEIKDDHSW